MIGGAACRDGDITTKSAEKTTKEQTKSRMGLCRCRHFKTLFILTPPDASAGSGDAYVLTLINPKSETVLGLECGVDGGI